jgi:hypothetical protein
MKKRAAKDPSQQLLHDFWDWFSRNAELLAKLQNKALVAELDKRVVNLNSGLSWEIGPGLSKPWQFVISPNLNRDLRALARSAISYAPALADWEFHSARCRKDWNYTFEMEGDGGARKHLNASTWTFVLLRHPNGLREILLKAERLPVSGSEQRRLAASIVLESALGEDLLLDSVDEFELVDELDSQFTDRQRPIQDLYPALAASCEKIERADRLAVLSCTFSVFLCLSGQSQSALRHRSIRHSNRRPHPRIIQ